MSYTDDPDLREKAISIARDCLDCSIEELPVVHGSATRFSLCEKHHRELYREYARHQRAESPADAEAVPGLVEGMAETDEPVPEAEAIARIAAEDPEAIEPAVDALLDAFQVQRGESVVDSDLYRATARALAFRAPLDERVRDRLVDFLADDDATVRTWAAAAIADAAWQTPDELLAAGTNDGGGGFLDGLFGGGGDDEDEPPRVIARLVALLDAGRDAEREQALRALGEFARTNPETVEPHADQIAELTASEDAAVRFAAGATLAALARTNTDLGMEHAQRFADLTQEADNAIAGIGIAGLAYLEPHGLELSISHDRVIENLKRMADPSRMPERAVREAVFALAEVGDESCLPHLEWVRDCAINRDLRAAADDAIDRLQQD